MPGAQVRKAVHPASKLGKPGAGCNMFSCNYTSRFAGSLIHHWAQIHVMYSLIPASLSTWYSGPTYYPSRENILCL